MNLTGSEPETPTSCLANQEQSEVLIQNGSLLGKCIRHKNSLLNQLSWELVQIYSFNTGLSGKFLERTRIVIIILSYNRDSLSFYYS